MALLLLILLSVVAGQKAPARRLSSAFGEREGQPSTLVEVQQNEWFAPLPRSWYDAHRFLALDPYPTKAAEGVMEQGPKVIPQWQPVVALVQPKCNRSIPTAQEYADQLPVDQEVAWTVSGGAAYLPLLRQGLVMWDKYVSIPHFLVALDNETADAACAAGWDVVRWTKAKESYSVVADVKFQLAAAFCSRGINFLFIELDVWMRKPIVPLLDALYHKANKPADMQISAHTNCPFCENIGFYRVKASPKMVSFFEALVIILKPSLTKKSYTYHLTKDNRAEKVTYFDQGALPSYIRRHIIASRHSPLAVGLCAQLSSETA
jgi:hypothetical protein